MGTQLMLAGLEQGGCGEAWNLTHPERVLAIQRRYVEAGSDCLLTNTFGGSRIMLARHGHAGDAVGDQRRGGRDRARGVRRQGRATSSATSARSAACWSRSAMSREADVREAFDEQARALVDAGVDAIIIETQTSLEELGLGLRAAREAGRALRHRLDGLRRDAATARRSAR